MNIDINIEQATNGVILRGRIGANRQFQAEVFSFSNPDWRTELSARLTELETQVQADVTAQFTQLSDQADQISAA